MRNIICVAILNSRNSQLAIVANSFQLPGINFIIDMMNYSDSELNWRSVLLKSQDHILIGNQKIDAMAIYLSVLKDALDGGWRLEFLNDDSVIFNPPLFESSEDRKHHIQRILDMRVTEHNQAPTIKNFLENSGSKSADFITNPKDIPNSPVELSKWFDGVNITVVESKQDKLIYRYLRHSWRIPYSTTPGRTMSFLVKNKNADVIGIFTLASPTLWMAGRDEALGFQELDQKKTQSSDDWIKSWRDIGLVDNSKKSHPYSGEFSINELINSMSLALRRRLEQLPLTEMEYADREELEKLGVNVSSTKPTQELNMSERNQAKRLRLYSKCIEALREISDIRNIDTVEDLWSELHGNDGSKSLLSALKHGLREQKNHVFAASIADISICGAIPPYNPLRVGKLIAMLTMSDFVSKSWESRYSEAISVISSEVAGRPIKRGSQFAAMSTTGLYGRGNIQYDRIKIGEGVATRKMQNIGETGEGEGKNRRGPSTLTVSRATWRLIDGYSKTYGIGKGTSGKFGEGSSARLRLLQATRKSILEQLPEVSDAKLWDQIVLNPFSRSVHICLLSRKSIRYILGIDPNLEHIAPLPSIQEVVEYWKNRWLEPALIRKNSKLIEVTKNQDISLYLPEFGGWDN